MSNETFEYMTTDYMISIESNEQTIQPVEYIVELGQEGIPGKQGEKGDPGFSPTVGYNLSDGHLTFTIVNEDGVTVTPDVFDYVMRKDGSNANNAINMNRLSILNNQSSGAKIASRYIDNTDKMNLEISGYPLKLTGTSYASSAYSNSITIAQGGSSITLGNTTKNNIIIDGTSARYNGAEIATRSNIGNGTVILTQGGVTKGSFSVNQSETSVIDLDAGGGAITNPLVIPSDSGNQSLTLGFEPNSSILTFKETLTLPGTGNVDVPLPIIGSTPSSPITLTKNNTTGISTLGLDYDNTTLGLNADNELTVIGGGTTYTAGTGIDITSDVIAVDFTEVATATQGSKADTAVQPGDLATVATTGDYTDLLNKPTIPTVNNSTITFTQGGTTKGSITLNQSSDATIALDAGSSPDNPLEPLTDKEGLANVTALAHSTFDASKFTVTNSAILINGVASNFFLTGADYGVVRTTDNIAFGSTFEFYFEFTTPSGAPGSNQNFLTTNSIQGISLALTATPRVMMQLGDGTQWVSSSINGSNNLSLSTSYLGRLSYNGAKYILSVSSDNGATWTQECEYTSATQFLPSGKLNFGGGRGGNGAFTGSMDLKQVKVISNNALVFSGNKTGIDTIKPDNYTVVGTPTISADGVASGFSDSNYITTGLTTRTTNNCEIQISFKTGSTNNTTQILCAAANGSTFQTYVNTSGYINVWLGTGSAWSYQINSIFGVSANTEYLLEIKISSTDVKCYVNGELKNTTAISSYTFDIAYINTIGTRTYLSNSEFLGSIDLNAFKIYVDGNLVYQPCLKIPYTLGNGSKVVNSYYRNRIEDAYNYQSYVRYHTLKEGTNYTLPTPPDKGYLSNLAWVYNNINSIPDYSAGITMDLGNGNFTSPAKGVIVLAGYTTGGTNIGGILTIQINSNTVYTNATNPTGYTYFDLCLPVNSGDIISLVAITTPATINTQKFFPLKEVN